MTPSESLLAHALRTCNIELSGSGRRRVLPPELNQGVLFNFNGYQSVGEYGLFLDELLEGVKRELVESGGRGSLGVMLELADLDCFLKHHGKGAMHELLFKGSWKIVEREPEVLDDVRRKAGLFFEVQAAAFQRWQAMRQGARELLATHREGLAKRGPHDLDRAGMAVVGEWKGTVTDAVELALGLEASGLMLFPAEMTQQERIIEIAGKWGVSVQHLDQILNQLMNRKAGPVKAIERMRGAVIARQEARDKL